MAKVFLLAALLGACGRPLDLDAPDADVPQSAVISVSTVGLYIGDARTPDASSSLIVWAASSPATAGLTQIAVHLKGSDLQVVDWTLDADVTGETTEYQAYLDGAVASFCAQPGGAQAASAITAYFSAADRSFSPPSADVMLGCPIPD